MVNLDDDDLLSSNSRCLDSSNSLADSINSDNENIITIRKPQNDPNKKPAEPMKDDLAYLDNLLDDDDLGVLKDDELDDDDEDSNDENGIDIKKQNQRMTIDGASPNIADEDIIAHAAFKMHIRGQTKGPPTRKQAISKEGPGSRPVITLQNLKMM